MSGFGVLGRAWAILSPAERRKSVTLAAALGVAALAELASVASFYPLLAVIADPGLVLTDPRIGSLHALAGRPDERTFLVQLGAFVLAMTIVANTLVALVVWWQVRFVWSVNDTLSRRLLARHLDRPYADFLVTNSSVFAKHVLTEAQTLVVNTLDPAFTLAGRLATAVLIAGLLVALSPLVTLAFFGVVAALYAAILLPLRGRLKTSGAAALAADQWRFRSVNEALGGIKQVKVGGLEGLFQRRYEPHSRAYSRHQATHNLARRLPYYAMQTVAFGGVTLLLIALVALGYEIAQILPIVGVIAVGGFRLLPAFQQILAAGVALRFTSPVIDAIHAELAAAPSKAPRDGGTLEPRRSIALEGITFQHLGAPTPTLVEASVRIAAGSSVAFVGATGAGKSTLLDVLIGLLPPTEGSIRIDDQPVTPGNVRAWQRAIGYVPQGVFLMDDTISANIAFGEPDERRDQAHIERAARVAQIHDFIDRLPQRYATMVGERGVRLSGGQRQRIGIARALYHDPPVLVLDEATSDIDNKTEAEIVRSLASEARGKTLILVAHRFATTRGCDAIHVLDSGRIVASGTYEELLARDLRFRELAVAEESRR